MRVLLQITFCPQSFNAAIKDGTVSAKMQKLLADLKPEAAYFTEFHGKRTGIFITDLKDPSSIPAIAEPWFLTFNAAVEIHPVMLPEDLVKANLDAFGKKWA